MRELFERRINPNFEGIEFETFENEAGKNNFYLFPQKWISNKNAIGLFLNQKIIEEHMLMSNMLMMKNGNNLLPNYLGDKFITN